MVKRNKQQLDMSAKAKYIRQSFSVL